MSKVTIEITGTYEITGDLITVTGPNGHSKTTQLGGTPPDQLAQMMLREIVEGR